MFCQQKEEISQKSFSVLIVEDSRVINNTLAARLKNKGYTCYQSYNLAQAREILKEHPKVDLIILDLHLPDGEGEELVKEIKEFDPDAKIIVFTSDKDLLRRDELFKMGVLDYLQKGKSVNVIIKEIENIIETIQINPNYTILIVDDSRMIRKMIQNILRSAGYRLIEAQNGKEALQKLQDDVDLILLDMEMPDMGGLEVVHHIKQDEKHYNLPIFIISSTLDIESMRNAYKAGVLDYFKKPFSPEELKLKVEQVIRHKEIQKELTCTLKAARLCNKFLDKFYATAILGSDLTLRHTNQKFQEIFANTSTLPEALHNFDSNLLKEIIIALQNHTNYKTKIAADEKEYLVKLFPISSEEFLFVVEIL